MSTSTLVNENSVPNSPHGLKSQGRVRIVRKMNTKTEERKKRSSV